MVWFILLLNVSYLWGFLQGIIRAVGRRKGGVSDNRGRWGIREGAKVAARGNEIGLKGKESRVADAGDL